MCWPAADPFWDQYYSSKEDLIHTMKSYTGYYINIINNPAGMHIQMLPYKYSSNTESVIKLNSYFEGEEMNPPVILLTQNEELREFVESLESVKIMRTSMIEIRRIIREDRVYVKLKYGIKYV